MDSTNEGSYSETVDEEQAIVRRARQDELRNQPLKRRELALFAEAPPPPPQQQQSLPPPQQSSAKKQKREAVARETERIAARFESAEQMQRLEEDALAATKDDARCATQTVIQTSLREPLPPGIREKIANPLVDKSRQAPPQAAPTAASDANRKLRIQASARADGLRLSALWDHATFPPSKNIDSKARCVWPHYDAWRHYPKKH